MRWPLIAMAGMAVALAIIVAVSLLRAADLSWRSQQFYISADDQGPTQKQQDQARDLAQEASELQQLITPFSTGSLACGLGILFVLGRRWQLRPAPHDIRLGRDPEAAR